MNVIHIGSKNFPPAHGGVEKVVYDIIKGGKTENKSFVLVEWKQEDSDLVKVLPKGIIRQILFIVQFCSQKGKKKSILHFHKETFALHAIVFSMLGYKVMLTIHGCAWRIKRWGFIKRTVLFIIDLLSCLFVDRVVFVGKSDYDLFYSIFRMKKICFIPNGVDNQKEICSADTEKCVYIGRVSPEKNILSLIDCFINKNATLDIYGPFDKHMPEYEEQVISKINNINNVSYKGVLSYDSVIKTLLNYNTFCNFSYSEGMPVAVLEAASVGMNLILSNIPAHKKLEFPDVYYVDTCNPKLDDFFKNGYSVLNFNHQREYYSIQQMQKKYWEAYEQFS